MVERIDEMQFFDGNAFFGLPMKASLAPVATAQGFVEEMERAGIGRALVWHIAQHDASPQLGNQLLTEAIQPHARLWGCWTIMPNQAKEFPPPQRFFEEMKAAKIAALRVFPAAHRFLLNAVSMGQWLEPMVERHIPLFISVKRGAGWQEVYSILAEFPDLVCVICDHGCWGMDRMFRPLLERYPNVYIDTAQYFLDGGIEALVTDYGAGRILFGSGFPESYFGGMMMVIKHARIPDEVKADIASRNLERLLAEVQL